MIVEEVEVVYKVKDKGEVKVEEWNDMLYLLYSSRMEFLTSIFWYELRESNIKRCRGAEVEVVEAEEWTFTLHLSHLADALIQSDLQIGRHKVRGKSTRQPHDTRANSCKLSM
jgi:hypothetical protein